MVIRLLHAVAWIRRRVPYGILKNVVCEIESAIEAYLAKRRPHFTIERLIRDSGAWFGGKDPTFHVQDFIRMMKVFGAH